MKKILGYLDAAAWVNGKSVRAKQKYEKMFRSPRKRTVFYVTTSLITTSLALGVALFAHPWENRKITSKKYFATSEMNKMDGMNLDGHITDPSLLLLKEETLIKKLNAPDGIDIEPMTGSIYITEEDAAQVVRVDTDGQRTIIIDAKTAVFEQRGTEQVAVQGLRSPEGIAFGQAGKVYIVEDIPGGRLIEFSLPEYSLNETQVKGLVVHVPQPDPGYAWESIAVSTRGELLLAGSNVEAFLADNPTIEAPSSAGLKVNEDGIWSINERMTVDLPSGAVIYRDASGTWWMPIHRPLESFSGACFTPDGRNAYFISEAMGYVGCFDLKSHVFQSWFSDVKIDSPEGVTALSDGTAIVVSEKGKVFRVDAHDDMAVEIYDLKSAAESVAWDPARGRLMITQDGEGKLTSLNNVYYALSQKMKGPIDLGHATFEVEIPEDCPDYLAGLLNKCGYDPFSKMHNATFQDLVKNVALFAIDAEATLKSSDGPVTDPIVKVQFAIFTPHFFGVDISGFSAPASGFAAVHASGEMDRTRLHNWNVTSFDFSERRFSAFTPNKLALPHPASYRLSPEGTASVSFMGMGETPDFHVIINMNDPESSYMVAIHPDGKCQQYALKIPQGKSLDHWVVGLKRDNPEAWKNMSLAEKTEQKRENIEVAHVF